MSVPFASALIRYERLRRNWSMEGLCQGVCAISYLSKIEQGKADPGPDILRALMQRLEIRWHDGTDAARWVEEMLEAGLSFDHARSGRLLQELDERREQYVNGPQMLNVLLLEKWLREECRTEVDLSAFENCFDERQRALWMMGQNRSDEAVRLLPCAYTWLMHGSSAYCAGAYTQAIERLLHACSMAMEEGRARVLLQAKVLLGNCYSDQQENEAMKAHYAAAMRLARDLGEEDTLETVRYNIASTDLQLQRVEQAYAYFAALKEPGAMALHKLAICEERLGRTEDALRTIERARKVQCSYPPQELYEQMLDVVAYRLTHPDYLRRSEYGEKLLSCFDAIRRALSNGYAVFHLPWVEEWYTANRQYKQAYELKKLFS